MLQRTREMLSSASRIVIEEQFDEVLPLRFSH